MLFDRLRILTAVSLRNNVHRRIELKRKRMCFCLSCKKEMPLIIMLPTYYFKNNRKACVETTACFAVR